MGSANLKGICLCVKPERLTDESFKLTQTFASLQKLRTRQVAIKVLTAPHNDSYYYDNVVRLFWSDSRFKSLPLCIWEPDVIASANHVAQMMSACQFVSCIPYLLYPITTNITEPKISTRIISPVSWKVEWGNWADLTCDLSGLGLTCFSAYLRRRIPPLWRKSQWWYLDDTISWFLHDHKILFDISLPQAIHSHK
jgi:hypothetical protein